MAVSVSINSLSTYTDHFFLPTLKDNFFLNSAFWAKLKEVENPVEGGDDIRFPISYAKSTVASRWAGRLAPVTLEFQEHATQGVLNPRQYTASVTLPDTDVAKNRGRAKLVNMIKAQMELAEKSLSDLLDIDAFLDGSVNAAGVRGIDGLGAILTRGSDPATGAYAGISRTSASGSKNGTQVANAFWNANVVAANANGTVTFWKGDTSWDADTTLTTLKMQTMFGACTHGKAKPTIILTSQVLYDKYWSLLTEIQRQMTDDSLGKLGFDSLTFNNRPVVVADNIDDAGKMYFLNMDTFEWNPYSEMNFSATPFRYNADQLAQIKIISVMGNIHCNDPNANGVITALTAT